MEVPLPNGMEEKEHILALPSYANKKVVTKNRCTPPLCPAERHDRTNSDSLPQREGVHTASHPVALTQAKGEFPEANNPPARKYIFLTTQK